MTATVRDYYDGLGVARDASQKDIERAFRKLARKYHPDASPGDTSAANRFKEINEAYQVLKDPEKRAAYDNPEPDWQSLFGQQGQPSGRFEFRGNVSPEDLSDLLGGLGGCGRGGFVDLGDLSGSSHSWQTGGFDMPGGDVEALLTLSLHEAHRGGKRSVSLGGKRLEIDVPRGVTEGSVIRLAGQGHPGIGGGKPGDLLLRVTLAPDPRFTVRGHALETEVKLAPWEAVLGAKVSVPTLGKPVQLTIPPGTQSGKKLRLRGQGLNKRSGGRGDLYARVKIVVPTDPTREELRLYEELARASHGCHVR